MSQNEERIGDGRAADAVGVTGIHTVNVLTLKTVAQNLEGVGNADVSAGVAVAAEEVRPQVVDTPESYGAAECCTLILGHVPRELESSRKEARAERLKANRSASFPPEAADVRARKSRML